MTSTTVVVGAGVAGLRTTEALRASGHTGAVVVLGDEPFMPYNRPPLSKSALAAGADDMAKLLFRRKPAVDDVAWRLGTAVTGIELAAQALLLSDGTWLEFDGLVVATGIRPRRLPIPGPSEGRFALRSVTDARAIRPLLIPGARLVILGAGFVGCEVAATARSLGCEVTVVASDPEPMVRPLGSELGAAIRQRHESMGVSFRLGTAVEAVEGADRISSVQLSDGTELPADLLIEAVGSVPNTEWLEGSGLDVTDGVLVDAAMQASPTAAPVVVAGDVARFPLAAFGATARRVEHWNMPSETGRRAGRTLAALLAGREPDPSPFTALPSFWSDQYTFQIQSLGMPGLASSSKLVAGGIGTACVIEYRDGDDLVGVVTVDRTADLAPYYERLSRRS